MTTKVTKYYFDLLLDFLVNLEDDHDNINMPINLENDYLNQSTINIEHVNNLYLTKKNHTFGNNLFDNDDFSFTSSRSKKRSIKKKLKKIMQQAETLYGEITCKEDYFLDDAHYDNQM